MSSIKTNKSLMMHYHLANSESAGLIQAQDRHTAQSFNSSQIFHQNIPFRHSSRNDAQGHGDTDRQALKKTMSVHQMSAIK